jgi:Putative prokaryotic signal transducing protein
LQELVRTNDPVLVSAIEAMLDAAEIQHMVVDVNMSALERGIAIFPCRILVADDHVAAARRLLQEAGLGHELRPDGT